jgi:ribonuclease HI
VTAPLSGEIRLFCDGASRGNPGPSSAGAVLYDASSNVEAASLSRYLGEGTNNQAEYQALILGLEEASRLGARKVSIFADSQLLVRQLCGQYRVKNPQIQSLFGQVIRLLNRFESWQASHIPREQNSRADELANEALDKQQS